MHLDTQTQPRIEPIHIESIPETQEFYLNRDLSWLEFNARVLDEALDTRTPLFERLRFLGIFQSNLDEYYMKRMASLSGQGRTTFHHRLLPLLNQAQYCFENEISPQLKDSGVEILRWHHLSEPQKEKMNAFFKQNIFPVLTPLAVDSGHPFPFISNLSLSIGVLLRYPGQEDEDRFARLKVPSTVPHWLRIEPSDSSGGIGFISVIEVITANLSTLFTGIEILSTMLFRVTRNTNIDTNSHEADNLLDHLSEELKERKFGEVVRLEYWGNGDSKIIALLTEELGLATDQIYGVHGLLDYSSLKPILDLPRPEHKFSPWVPLQPQALSDPDRDIFQAIRHNDILVHHPYESFSGTVERFIRTAVNDPKVVAIKMTLYRVGAESPLIPLLIRAAELGKQVICLVELKARFDEEKNILVAQSLEDAGVHVVYGVVGLKTHCKLALVVRQEGEETRSYCHIGTGNYHSLTSRLYTDFGLFTCNREIADDVIHLFHYLTGKSLKRDYKKLLVAPVALRDRFLELIERESLHARSGRPARIIAKMNALDDREIIQKLYQASTAGVQIDLIVRGFCCLRPGVPGLSEHIRVRSIIGRFLEHSRVFYFQNGKEMEADGDLFIGSADWMHRNLSSRVEAAVPIEGKNDRERIIDFLDVLMSDQRQGWDLMPNGTYVRGSITALEYGKGTHAQLMHFYRSNQ